MDILQEGRAVLEELGVQVELSGNEAAAAAMLGASINYPLRGAIAFKSVVGTNFACDALSNLSSPGVRGGVLILLGEDYGEGSVAIQERSHGFALKSQMWLLDPRPDLPTITNLVEKAFELSEASNTPVMMQLRVRACMVSGEFQTKANKPPPYSRNNLLEDPTFDHGRIAQVPSIYAHERHKVNVRWPAATRFIRENRLNEMRRGDIEEIGFIVQGGLFNAAIRALQHAGLADSYGNSRVPIYVLNVTYPLISEELSTFAGGKHAVLVIEEGQPAYIEESVRSALSKADINADVVGKQVFAPSGDYTSEIMLTGIVKFLEGSVPRGVDLQEVSGALAHMHDAKKAGSTVFGVSLPARLPTFCTGCPERPVFSALKLVERDIGKFHVSNDVGCHSFSSLAPFSIGQTQLGYGLGLASSTAVGPTMKKRAVSVMGDGGFWHNGLTSGIVSHQFNKNDGVLVILQNGYSSSTGHQHIPNSAVDSGNRVTLDIARTLKALGVSWVKTVRSYSIGEMTRQLKKAMTTSHRGLKVIIADGECQLARQKRISSENLRKLEQGEKTVRTKFGVDHDVCTGDHSCIRLSGCPSLTIKPNPDPLRTDPVASVIETCVGCGNCGEVAHAAVLCPSFYKAEVIQNPTVVDRFKSSVRNWIINRLQRLSSEGPGVLAHD
jgi:indolepyruvate ferredoxin oxidoreductase alpha subunit